MRLSGSKAHALWYADLGREAKKETAKRKLWLRLNHL